MRRAGILIAAILAFLAYVPDTYAQKQAAATAATDATEDEVKAGLIFNFGKYTEWPAGAFPNADSPMIIGVLGDDSFAKVLEDKVGGKTINGHKLVVRKLKWPKDVKDPKDFKDCHMVYIAAAEAAHGDDAIQMLRTMPILTIADFPNFARHAGIINFIREGDSIRFEANPDAAKASDLTISSRLLGSAKIVLTGLAWR